MENNQIMLMEKLGVIEILKESLKIPYKCPKFIIFTFLTSLPLYFTMVLYELILLQTFIETKTYIKRTSPNHIYIFSASNHIEMEQVSITDPTLEFIQKIYHTIPQLAFLYLFPLHFLDLLNMITTIDSVSMIYAGERSMGLKEMLQRSINKTRFKGPLITSLYVLPLNLLASFGLTWAVTTSFVLSYGTFFMVSYGVGSILLLVKWSDWSAIWNMGVIISILEERCGIEALGGSAYFSRGSRQRGLILMLVFFVWRFGVRLSCLYVKENEIWSGFWVISGLVSLACFGNLMKWVVCLVYFYDCKKRILEKKVDVEEGKEVKILQTNLS